MIELDNRIIGIKEGKRIIFFYFHNSQMNLFKRYLYQNNWIDLAYDEKFTKKGNYLAHPVLFVYKIEVLNKLNHIVYYNKLSINKASYDFMNSLGNKLFLDLEMTMPSYSFKGKGFRTEIIQAGLLLVDENGKTILKYDNYIKAKLSPIISKRALDFLKITADDYVNKAIDYNVFYNDFKDIIEKYHPAIIVYGKNDILVLNDSYDINEVTSLKNECRFINLCQLIKSYYELKNDPGLFKLYNIFYKNEDEQVHDALSDSYATYKVFEAFKEDVKNAKMVEVIRENFD
ncbi:MAG: hypothetical protein IKP77_03060 [Acholeplasmatales bacterium]|nr:hypothetical protein [Acholeplasmatales bacterium]